MTEKTSSFFRFNPSRLFILRPIATSLIMVALFLAGILAYRLLPVSALPQVDYPTIQVTTLYPGASPDVMTSAITAPLERQFGQMPGLKQMTSSNSAGASIITLQFVLNLDLDIAEQTVQAAINSANNFLPDDLPLPPIYNKVNPADAPILTIALSSKSMPLSQVEDLADTRLAQRIAQLSGVGLVSIAGGQRPAVRVQVNYPTLAAYNLSLEDVKNAIVAANVNLPKGIFDGPFKSAIIDNNDQLRSASEYRDLVIAYRNNAPVKLSDVANILDSVENLKLSAWSNQTACLLVNIRRQPGANVIEVVDRIKQLLPQLQAGLPAALDVEILTDRTETIRASVHDVQFELMLAIALVVMVIFLFLRNLPATIIPGVAVPLSLIGTFAAMYLADFSINNLTLMALTIASGFVVDDAIVVIENIARYSEEQQNPLQAALKGSEQIGFTIISLTLSLVAVLIPLLFMGDVVGRLFREFAITLAVAILISGFISLTLTPMMCAKMLGCDSQAVNHETGFQKLINLYAQSLTWVLQHQYFTLTVAAITLALTILLYVFIPKGFFPIQDTGLIQGISEAPASISFAAMQERQSHITRTLLADPAVASVSTSLGVDGNNTTLNTGRFLISLKARSLREDSNLVIARLRPQLAAISGLSSYLQPVQDLTLENRVSPSQYQFTLQAMDSQELSLWSKRLINRLEQSPHLIDLDSDLNDGGLQIFVHIDRATASRLGVSTAAIDNTLYNAFGQRLISTIFTQSNQYRVVLEVDQGQQVTPQFLGELRVPSSHGSQIPLSAIASLSERTTALSINHLDQFPAVTIAFNLAPGSSLSEAIAIINQAKVDIDLPAQIRLDFQGASQAFNASLIDTLWLILAAIVTVYIVLGILYESYIHPLTILSTLPSAGVGALLALIMTGHDLDIIAIIGIILLIGIVKKNAIMMIDFALDAERQQQLAPEQAIYQACLLRFRPILMTTLAALLGALPLMLSSGVGAEIRHPLGITMVGGLLVSQLLTLYTTPVIYLTLDRLAMKFRPQN